jgi:hypothetical protein
MNPTILLLAAAGNITWGIIVGSDIVIGLGTILAFMGVAQTVRDYEQKPETMRSEIYEDEIIDAEYIEVTEEDR